MTHMTAYDLVRDAWMDADMDVTLEYDPFQKVAYMVDGDRKIVVGEDYEDDGSFWGWSWSSWTASGVEYPVWDNDQYGSENTPEAMREVLSKWVNGERAY